uniref:RNA polymerase II subunit B1 CTD phosphatase RPAP2 homolog n=2 Tax=Biomphalaria glabrata TaxID=6526 RepID=A0A2C9KUZ8_BIOGL
MVYGMGEKLKAYQTTILKRVECEKKAFDIVNKLIDETVDGDYLIRCGHLITREHYNDIVEERAITMLCGYPVCGKTLENIPKKKYHISTISNKVYDISERKNFCSNQCLKASKYFCNQIPESPLWSREKEILPAMKLIPLELDKGIIGEEVVGASPIKLLKEELSKLDELDAKMSTLSLSSEEQIKQEEKHFKKECSLPDSSAVSDKIKDALSLMENPAMLNVTHDETSGDIHKSVSDRKKVQQLISKETNIDSSVPEVSTDLCLNPNTTAHSTSKYIIPTFEQQKSNKAITEKISASSSVTDHQNPGAKLEQLQKILSRKKGILSEMIVDMQPSTFLSLPAVDTNKRVVHYQDSATADLNHKQLQEDGKEKVHKKEKKVTGQLKNIFQLPLQQITNSLKTWVTNETSSYLFSSSSGDNNDKLSFSDPKLQQEYAQLCKRLNDQEKDFDNLLQGDVESEVKAKVQLKSVPDYQKLKQETESFQLQVLEFITGKKPEPQKDSDEIQHREMANCLTQDDNTNSVYLPTIDSYDQQQIRMRIVLYQLDKVMPDLLAPLSLPLQLISSLIRELVSTFKLQKDTIVFKPSEWTLIAILILKMLSKKSKSISEAFCQDAALRYFSILLKGIDHTMEDFDKLTDDILSCCNKML